MTAHTMSCRNLGTNIFSETQNPLINLRKLIMGIPVRRFISRSRKLIRSQLFDSCYAVGPCPLGHFTIFQILFLFRCSPRPTAAAYFWREDRPSHATWLPNSGTSPSIQVKLHKLRFTIHAATDQGPFDWNGLRSCVQFNWQHLLIHTSSK